MSCCAPTWSWATLVQAGCRKLSWSSTEGRPAVNFAPRSTVPATSAAWVFAHEDTGSDTSLPESPRQVPGGKTTAWSASATFPVEEKQGAGDAGRLQAAAHRAVAVAPRRRGRLEGADLVAPRRVQRLAEVARHQRRAPVGDELLPRGVGRERRAVGEVHVDRAGGLEQVRRRAVDLADVAAVGALPGQAGARGRWPPGRGRSRGRCSSRRGRSGPSRTRRRRARGSPARCRSPRTRWRPGA